ncbi:MAG: M20/M25/M40 family metallo-hydrolase [Alicyclobacillaceae bacterium]|nr:M20/M25/M40 family metallo-hydrolase [Alicyclobacillaceae bacterium]
MAVDERFLRALFLELLTIDSPPLREGRLAARCKQELQSLGFRIEEDDAGRRLGGECGNLLATLPGDPARPAVLLAAHLDTVETACGVRPQVDDGGVVRSDGTTALGADDKAGVAAILAAVRAVAVSRPPRPTVRVLLTVAEELGSRGAKWLQAGWAAAQFGLVLDAPGPAGALVVSGAHCARWEVVVRTPLRQGARQGDLSVADGPSVRVDRADCLPAKGEAYSATRLAAQAVAGLRRMERAPGERVEVSGFGGLDGRTGVRLSGEVSTADGGRLERLVSQVHDAFRQSAPGSADVEFSWEKVYDGFSFSPEHPLRRRAERAVVCAGLVPRAVASTSGSDANVLCSLGLPVLNLGVGYRAQHGCREHVALRDVVRAAEIALWFCLLPDER